MKKLALRFAQLTCLAACLALAPSCRNGEQKESEKEELRERKEGDEPEFEDEENEKYDGPMERNLLEIEKTKDPALGYVPVERLWNAIEYTAFQKQNYRGNSLLSGIWEERGPSYDSVGPSNGNSRPGGAYTAGRVRAVLVDASDASGNTVYTGGVNGGLWKCTNFLDAVPDWQAINDNFDNMAISYLCQSPANPNIMYFSTGEPASNADAVLGKGIWKSTDHGTTWNQLPSSTGFTRAFRILCDNAGNVYLASRVTAGLYRSNDGGTTWTNITPAGVPTICTDIEISSTGRLHASFGYATASTTIAYRYVDNPATATSASWNTGNGTPTAGGRMELAVKGDTVYAAPTNSANNIVNSYRSFDGGANWVVNNTTAYTTGLSSSQGWYNITLEIDPNDATQIMMGGLDAYRSTDTGKTVSRRTYWVTTVPYVHADHHYLKWWNIGGETRILIGCDGGLFLSRDNGGTTVNSWKDKNRNLNIKQFYSIAVHPTLTNYFLAGAQDNGSHQLKNAGLSYSTEVTGGDGAFVDIDQVNPQYQFTSYVYNQYRRSINGGNTWSSFNLNSGTGRFINPFTYDGLSAVLYATEGTGTVRRWENPTTATNTATSVSTILTVPALSSTTPSAFAVSPSVPNRLYVGTGNGRVVYIDYADTVANADVAANTTNITGFWGTSVYVSCIAVGPKVGNAEPLAVVMSNYGVNNVYHSLDGGATWTAIDGNLPDMPVRWVLFNPSNVNQLIIATEAGVYTTQAVNGASTVWTVSPGFPTVRTDMMKYRASDGLIAASTHGRGIFTTTLSQVLPLKDVKLQGSLAGSGIASLKWTTQGETNQTRYELQYSTDGISFNKIATLPSSVKQYRHNFTAATGYYRIMGYDPQHAAIFSNIAAINNDGKLKGLQVKVAPNPVNTATASFVVSGSEGGAYNWTLFDMQGRALQTGNGTLAAGGSQNQAINASKLASGMYRIRLVQGAQTIVTAFMKQ